MSEGVRGRGTGVPEEHLRVHEAHGVDAGVEQRCVEADEASGAETDRGERSGAVRLLQDVDPGAQVAHGVGGVVAVEMLVGGGVEPCVPVAVADAPDVEPKRGGAPGRLPASHRRPETTGPDASHAAGVQEQEPAVAHAPGGLARDPGEGASVALDPHRGLPYLHAVHPHSGRLLEPGRVPDGLRPVLGERRDARDDDVGHVRRQRRALRVVVEMLDPSRLPDLHLDPRGGERLLDAQLLTADPR